MLYKESIVIVKIFTIDIGEYMIYTFFIGVNKGILTHYGIWGQIIKSVLMCKQFVRFSSNLIRSVGQKKKGGKPLFISMQIIVEK